MSIINNLPDDFSEIHLVPYTHTDFSWTNSRKWHIWRYIYGFKRALEIMRDDPEFTFVIDNVHHSWLAFEKYCPELLDEVKVRVAEGRLIIANGGYSLARPNYTGDEAFVRNLIEGIRYFNSKFDIPEPESHFFFNADTGIGHSQLPQILSLSGNKYYRSNRPSRTLNRKGIPRQFVWRGLDGSEVIVARGDYGGLFITDYMGEKPDMDRDWDRILQGFWDTESVNACNSEYGKLMLNFGCDDVIPGCNLTDRPVPYREFMDAWNRHQKGKMFLSTPGRYFSALESEKEKLPAVEGVLDNCELSYNVPIKGQKSMWYRRRKLERLIIRLENLRSMLADFGTITDSNDVHRLWLDLMSISGHALEWVLVGDIEKLEAQGDEAILRAQRLIDEAEELICELTCGRPNADERITEYVIINPLPEQRDEAVKLHVTTPYGLKGLLLRDTDGNNLPYQVTRIFVPDKPYGCECNSAELLVKVSVPACGWNTITAYPSDEAIKYDKQGLDSCASPLGRDGTPLTIDTGAVRATFKSGRLVSVEHGGRVINGKFGQLRFSEFRPKSTGWAPCWSHSDEFELEPSEWGLVSAGELRQTYRVKGKVRTSDAVVDISLHKDSPRIDFKVTLNCDKNEGIFTASFPCDADTELYADIPYGVEHRDLTSEPSAEVQAAPDDYFFWESAWRGQFYARNFALFTGGGVDTAIISDTCSMYYSLRRDLGTVSLLLASQLDITDKSDNPCDAWVKLVSPAFMGLGENTYEFSYCPFEKSDKKELLHRAARAAKLLHFKLSAVNKFGFGKGGALPQSASSLSHSGADAIITANYCENGERIIRGYESTGVGGTVYIRVTGDFSGAYKADLLGNKLDGDVAFKDGELVFDVRPWEIFTLRLQK